MGFIDTVSHYLHGARNSSESGADTIDERLVARHEAGMDYAAAEADPELPGDVPDRFREELESAERLPGGLSNELWESADGDIIKRMEEKPGTRYSVALGNVLADGFHIPTYEERRMNEEEMPDIFSRTGTNTADVQAFDENYKKESKVPGSPLKDADLDPDEVYRVAYKFGSNLRRFHNEGYALTDARLSNLLVDSEQSDTPSKPDYLPDDPLQSWVDFEYAKTDASEREQEMDHITLISSARQLSPDRYEAFLDGYEDGYGEEVDDTVHLQANITSPLHAGVQEPDLAWYRNQKENRETDLDYGLTDLLRDKAGIVLRRQRDRAHETVADLADEYGF